MGGRPVNKLCIRCHRVRPHTAHGLCNSCYSTVHYPYEPTGTGSGGRGVEKSAAALVGRLGDFHQYRRVGRTVVEASRLVGISSRTAWRYEARRKAEISTESTSTTNDQGETCD